MVNNGIVAVMVVGVGGMVSGETAASGDTQFYPKVTVDAEEKAWLPDAAFLLQTGCNILIK